LLARDRDGWTVRDLESTNGLWLDDERRHAGIDDVDLTYD
jgi:pSer/pThr/pTyr-binding forkhead associated (FHA) protein